MLDKPCERFAWEQGITLQEDAPGKEGTNLGIFVGCLRKPGKAGDNLSELFQIVLPTAGFLVDRFFSAALWFPFK